MIIADITHKSSAVLALHCSFGSGRQWSKLSKELESTHHVHAPDLSGYGSRLGETALPTTLADEVAGLGDVLDRLDEPIHLVGHSYGGAVAFKIAASARFARRVRSLTLIEPVLPTLLKDDAADQRLHDQFAQLGRNVSADLWSGLYMEAIERFMSYWNGSGPVERVSAETLVRMIQSVDKIAYDFEAVLAERNVISGAVGLDVPTLLISGGLSPYLTQRIVSRLVPLIRQSDVYHFPSAGHMIPLSHAEIINPLIVAHIRRTDDLASVSLASETGENMWSDTEAAP
jgi:pimeloyl-ACP methyl ester carboxylesterase